MFKRVLPYLLFVAVTLTAGFPQQVLAQDCSGYYLLSNNAEYEMITYDKKDKLTGRVHYKVTSVNSSPNETEATIHSKVFDNKGKLTTEGDYVVTCKGESISIDMRSIMNQGMLEAYKDMEVKMQGDFIDYPTSLSAGQKLNDGTMTIDVLDKKNGQALSSIVMSITDRKVGDKESINVPAGSYNAYKINQEMEMQTKAMGMNLPSSRIQTVEYFAPGVGVVRSESYRNGKLMSYSVLNKVSK